MSDFSLRTLFVVPVGDSLPSSGSTQDLTAGQLGFFRSDYTVANAGNIAAAAYFYVAQGRVNNYLQGSKKSDKIKGCASANCTSNVTKFYKISGCSTAATQVTDVSGFNAKCGDVLTLTLRAHSSYLDTLYFNGLTRSVTVQAPCCDCGADPCDVVDVPSLIDQFILALEQHAPGINPDNIILSDFFQFQRIGNDANAILRISGKALTRYAQPCDIAAFPYEYDRMWFRTFIYAGPATTADFIVFDPCNLVANAVVTQRATYPSGTPDEIRQLEKDYYSYQAAYLKALYRMNGYNENFESYVSDNVSYDTFVIKFNEIDKSENAWNAAIQEDSEVIIAVPSSLTSGIETVLTAALGTFPDDGNCFTTTSTTTTDWPTTSTTSTLTP